MSGFEVGPPGATSSAAPAQLLLEKAPPASSSSRAGAAARSWLTLSLVRNASYLMANLVVVTAAGLVATVLATRLYSAAAVGLSAATLAVATIAVNIGALGAGQALIRLLPEATDQRRTINTAATVTLIGSTLAAGICLVIPVISGEVTSIPGAVHVVVVGSVLIGLQGTSEATLIALRDGRTVLVSSAAAALVRIVAVIALAPVSTLGPFIAAIIASAVAIIGHRWVLWRRHRYRPGLCLARDALRQLWRYALGVHLAALTGGIPLLMIPVIVLSHQGPVAVAYWSVAMSLATFIFMLPAAVNRSLLAEGAARPDRWPHLVRQATVMTLAASLPAALVVTVAAPLLLSVFGAGYSDGGSTTLRWLAISTALVAPSYILGSILLLARRTVLISAVNLVNAAVVLAIVQAADSLVQVGIAWVMGELVNVALFGAGAIWVVSRDPARWRRQ